MLISVRESMASKFKFHLHKTPKMRAEQNWMGCFLSFFSLRRRHESWRHYEILEKLLILNKKGCFPFLFPTGLALKNETFPLFQKNLFLNIKKYIKKVTVIDIHTFGNFLPYLSLRHARSSLYVCWQTKHPLENCYTENSIGAPALLILSLTDWLLHAPLHPVQYQCSFTKQTALKANSTIIYSWRITDNIMLCRQKLNYMLKLKFVLTCLKSSLQE